MKDQTFIEHIEKALEQRSMENKDLELILMALVLTLDAMDEMREGLEKLKDFLGRTNLFD